MDIATDTIIQQGDFVALMQHHAQLLMGIADYWRGRGIDSFALNRPLLKLLLAESTNLEEILDAFGARTNTLWYPFRVQVAILKNFSEAAFELLHLKQTSQGNDLYNSVSYPHFQDDLQKSLQFLTTVLFYTLGAFVTFGEKAGMKASGGGQEPPTAGNEEESLPLGRLPRDRKNNSNDSVEERIVHIATSFLHRTTDMRGFRHLVRMEPSQWKQLDFEILNEGNLREQEGKLHNLQSLYDTYISDSDTENADPSLGKLRAYISACLHLFKAMTIFIHFYERHIKYNRAAEFCDPHCKISGDVFFGIITKCLMNYICQFLESAQDICKQMLASYVHNGSVEVQVPPYVGFHVRPSTLVAAIINHYGSKVTLSLPDGTEYEIRSSLDFPRVNGWIDQQKRDALFSAMSKLDFTRLTAKLEQGIIDKGMALHYALVMLANHNLIRIHRFDYDLHEFTDSPNYSKMEFLGLLGAVIVRFQATRIISIIHDVKITFHGDTRVLRDLALLAENGYGENEVGTNIPLPKELAYLNAGRLMTANG